MSTSSVLRDAGRQNRCMPLVLLLFVGSGCAALIYEIVWFQLIGLVIGSSAVSLGVLLGTFMGGMCLGSLLLPRLVSARRHPLRVYGLLEAGIGLLGIALLWGMPRINAVYAAHVGSGSGGIMLRAGVCAICLLPPTFLMGATLPAVSRWVQATADGVSWLGFFYAGNTVGAVVGCLSAGFYLLRLHDVGTATNVAVGINAFVAVGSWVLAGFTSGSPADPPGAGWRRRDGAPGECNEARRPEQAVVAEAPAAGWVSVYVAIALSGLCALAAEVIWTRLLSLILGATVYTFSIILAVFLAGLGIGSGIGSAAARRMEPRQLLGWCQLLLIVAIAWAAHMLSQTLPYWPISAATASRPWTLFAVDLWRSTLALLPAACLWGASFPVALACVVPGRRDAGRTVGAVYAANTVGAIFGAIGFSLLVIPGWGTQAAQRVIIGLSALASVIMLSAAWRGGASRRARALAGSATATGMWHRLRAAGSLGLCAVLGILLTARVPPVNGQMIADGRHLSVEPFEGALLYVGEGMNSSIAVSQWPGGVREFHVSGKVEASNVPQDMRLQRMLGHIPALVHPAPSSVLVVGCGSGVTAGSFVVYPSVRRIVICEIEPLIAAQVAGRFFTQENHDVVHDPRVQIVYDDARHYVLRSHEKFDIITSDPIHPWVKGAATLYTREYFDMCRRHLNEGGIVTQWVPLYESDLATVKSEIATFIDVFPDTIIWGNDDDGLGYDIVLMGMTRPGSIHLDDIQRRLDRADHAEVERSLSEVGLGSALAILLTYAGQGRDLKAFVADAQINRDRDLRLQYLAGMGLNLDLAPAIYRELLSYRRYPDDLFVTSPLERRTFEAEFAAQRRW